MTKIQVNSSGKAYVANGKALAAKEFGTKSITQNGTYAASSDSLDGYSSVTVNVSGGGSANIDSLSITPTTSQQTITASGGVDGYSPITVSAVTSSIDSNITAGNIKDGISILGVTGSYTGSGGASTKFGVSIDNFIGNVTNGVLGRPSIINGITFTGVTEIGDQALQKVFVGSSAVSGAVNFPDLITVGSLGLQEAFSENSGITSVSFPSLTTISSNGLQSAFQYNQITSVDLSALTTVSDNGLMDAFTSNQITTVDLSALTTVSDNGLNSAFYNNQNITSINLSSLTTVGDNGLNSAFASNQITTVDLSALTTVGNYGLSNAFNTNRLTSVNLSSLTTVDDYALYSAFSNQVYENDQYEPVHTLTSVSFPALTSQSFGGYTYQFNEMLNGDENVTVHFPSNLQSVIGSWDDVLAGFGGTNTTVLFDLPSTAV